jgi:hypothetical protein
MANKLPSRLDHWGCVVDWLNQLFESLNKLSPSGSALIALVLVFAIVLVMKLA